MKTVHLFLGSDLRSGHVGLTEQAKKEGVFLQELPKGTAVVFINRKQNKIKSYSYNGVLSYVRFDDKRRGIDMNAIDELPKAFNPDGTMDYPRALRAAMEKRFASKKPIKRTEVF